MLYALGLEERIEHLIRSAGVEVVVDTLSRHPGSSWWWMAEEERRVTLAWGILGLNYEYCL